MGEISFALELLTRDIPTCFPTRDLLSYSTKQGEFLEIAAFPAKEKTSVNGQGLCNIPGSGRECLSGTIQRDCDESCVSSALPHLFLLGMIYQTCQRLGPRALHCSPPHLARSHSAALSTSCLLSALCLPQEQQGERIPLSPSALGFEISSRHT